MGWIDTFHVLDLARGLTLRTAALHTSKTLKTAQYVCFQSEL